MGENMAYKPNMAEIKELRERTGAGIRDCKLALVSTEGNIETAIDELRKKGIAKAAKKSGRAAAEGVHWHRSGLSPHRPASTPADLLQREPSQKPPEPSALRTQAERRPALQRQAPSPAEVTEAGGAIPWAGRRSTKMERSLRHQQQRSGVQT